MTGGIATVTVMGAMAIPPFPPLVDVTAVVVLIRGPPGVTPVTLTAKLHEPPAANVAPARLIVVVPPSAVIVPPPQDPVTTLGVDMFTPVGRRRSEKPTPVKATVAFGFVSRKLKVVLWVATTLDALNDFEMVGGPTTVNVAIEVFPGPPFVEVT